MTNFKEPVKKYDDLVNNFNANIFSLFKVNIHELLKNKFEMTTQEINASTIVIDSWFYWEYEHYIKLLNIKNKDEKEKQESQEGGKNPMGNMGNFNPSKLMSQYSPANYKSSIPRF